MAIKRLLIFISGSGSNARRLIEEFKTDSKVSIIGVVSSRLNSEMETFCQVNEVPFQTNSFQDAEDYLEIAQEFRPDFIILAGFLKKIPVELIQKFPRQIFNIHPSLLPKFGGKGMYGIHVHEAVLAANEKETGITIHIVNEEFDKGEHLAQFRTSIAESETVQSLQVKIHELEHLNFGKVIRNAIINMFD